MSFGMRHVMFQALGCERNKGGSSDHFALYQRIAGLVLFSLVSIPLAVIAVEEVEDEMFWKGAEGCESQQGTKLYLDVFPKGKFAIEAVGCISWEEVKGCEDEEAVEAFLRTYPENRYAGDARACLVLLQDKERRDTLTERLLSECQAHFESHRLTTGSGGNALDCYSRVLELDPGNADALSGIERIEQHYINRAESDLERASPDTALRWIERLALINPEHPLVEELKRRVEDLKKRLVIKQQLMRDIEALLAQGMTEQARSLLESVRKGDLDSKTVSVLERKIDRVAAEAEQERSLLDGIVRVRALIGEGETAAARAFLEEVVEMGLDDDRRAALEAEIIERERQVRAAEMARLVNECEDHFESDRLAESLSCYQKVLEFDGDHEVASERIRRIGSIMVWKRVDNEKTVEGYYGFERDYPESPLARLARLKLDALEEEYWQSVRESGDESKYRRYLQIYPAGRFKADALSRISGEG